MENMEDFCVSHNYTQRDLLLPPLPAFLIIRLLLHPSASSSFPILLPLYTCICIVFQN